MSKKYLITFYASQSNLQEKDEMTFTAPGEYYEENSPDLTIEREKEVSEEIEKANKYVDSFKCPYIKRRKISLIKVLGENDTVSPYLESAIAKNWHSLSDLKDYDELVDRKSVV